MRQNLSFKQSAYLIMRAAIYARYSSDNQRDASIEDQVRQCRARIDNQGWRVGEVYSDRAISGATTLRPGYQKMLEVFPVSAHGIK